MKHLEFDKATQLKHSFRRALPIEHSQPTEEIAPPANKPTSIGHVLYLIYRSHRIQQGFEEFKWESQDIAQRLVWERTAQTIGLKLE